jgi:hypothetical protein
MHANLPVTVNNVHITNNNITIVNTQPVYERPRHIQDAVDQRVHEGFRRPKPVGAIVKPAVNPHDAPQIIRRSGKVEAPHRNTRPEMKPLPQPEEQPRRRDDRKPIERKPVEQKPVVRKPVEQRPIEQKPVERKIERRSPAPSPKPAPSPVLGPSKKDDEKKGNSKKKG